MENATMRCSNQSYPTISTLTACWCWMRSVISHDSCRTSGNGRQGEGTHISCWGAVSDWTTTCLTLRAHRAFKRPMFDHIISACPVMSSTPTPNIWYSWEVTSMPLMLICTLGLRDQPSTWQLSARLYVWHTINRWHRQHTINIFSTVSWTLIAACTQTR